MFFNCYFFHLHNPVNSLQQYGEQRLHYVKHSELLKLEFHQKLKFDSYK